MFSNLHVYLEKSCNQKRAVESLNQAKENTSCTHIDCIHHEHVILFSPAMQPAAQPEDSKFLSWATWSQPGVKISSQFQQVVVRIRGPLIHASWLTRQLRNWLCWADFDCLKHTWINLKNHLKNPACIMIHSFFRKRFIFKWVYTFLGHHFTVFQWSTRLTVRSMNDVTNPSFSILRSLAPRLSVLKLFLWYIYVSLCFRSSSGRRRRRESSHLPTRRSI